jgi:hypothetical protein
MSAANMPHPLDPVQSQDPRRVIFVRQRFSQFGGGELILDRTISAMTARGVKVALLGRAWTERADIDFIHCDPPHFPRFRRERQFARAACARLAWEKDALVQSHERMPCCDIFRAGDGVHAAFIERRAGGNKLAHAALSLHPFHRSAIFDPLATTSIIGRTYPLVAERLDVAVAVLDEEEDTVLGLYRRVTVTTGSGRLAWAYAYGTGLELTPIESGDWFTR